MAALDALLENNNSNGLNSTNGSSSTNGEHSIIPAKAPPFSKRVEGQGQGQDQGQGQGQGDDGYGDAESSLRRGGNGVGMSRQSSGALPRAEEKVLRGGGGRATGGGGGGDGGAHWEEHPSLRRDSRGGGVGDGGGESGRGIAPPPGQRPPPPTGAPSKAFGTPNKTSGSGANGNGHIESDGDRGMDLSNGRGSFRGGAERPIDGLLQPRAKTNTPGRGQNRMDQMGVNRPVHVDDGEDYNDVGGAHVSISPYLNRDQVSECVLLSAIPRPFPRPCPRSRPRPHPR